MGRVEYDPGFKDGRPCNAGRKLGAKRTISLAKGGFAPARLSWQRKTGRPVQFALLEPARASTK
jgi:hypothetical protein